jgi:hypothetical protein
VSPDSATGTVVGHLDGEPTVAPGEGDGARRRPGVLDDDERGRVSVLVLGMGALAGFLLGILAVVSRRDVA